MFSMGCFYSSKILSCFIFSFVIVQVYVYNVIFVDHLQVWIVYKHNTDDSDQPNHEIDVLSGHENDVNFVQFSGCSVSSRFSTEDNLKEESVPKFRNSWFSQGNIVTCFLDGSAIIWIPRSRRSHGKVGR
ncbi:hypothetical protein CRYUN_Cryun36dG0101000 [Craigia yunnanensis]